MTSTLKYVTFCYVVDPAKLSEEELRRAILQALDEKDGARFVYDEKLSKKLADRRLSVQDLRCVCRDWQHLRSIEWDGSSWRYRVEGENLDGRWMATVLAVELNPTVVIAITGFRFARGRRKRS